MDNNAGILVRVSSSMCSDHVLLAEVGAAGVDVAILEDHGRVAKDKIDGASDEAGNEKLAVAVDVESVLVRKKVTSVEGGEVGSDS